MHKIWQSFTAHRHQIIIITPHIHTVIKGHNFNTPGAISIFSEKKTDQTDEFYPTTYDCQ